MLKLQHVGLSSIPAIVDYLFTEYISISPENIESCVEMLKKNLEGYEEKHAKKSHSFGEGNKDEDYENVQQPNDD